MSKERATKIAYDLLKIGVSHAGVQELLVNYPYDLIERQLAFLPHRKAKRPEAFIMEAIRRNYSPPKELFYAPTQVDSASSLDAVDKSSKRAPRSTAPNSQRHRTQGDPTSDSTNVGMEP